MISLLIEVGKRWQDSHYSLRKEAMDVAAQEFGLSKANFELGLQWIFSFWNKERLTKIQNENCYSNLSRLVQVLAGNTPAVMAQALLHGAIMQVPQIIKIPSLQSAFPRILHQSFNDVSEELGKLFYLDTWKHNLKEFYSHLSTADLVIAYGSDSTLALLKSYCCDPTIFIAHGHAVSCAIIFKDAANRESLSKLAWDMLSYDQRGCLSPSATFVERGGELSPDECAFVFSNEILPDVARKLPQGNLFPGEAAAIMQKRAMYRFRGVIYSGIDWTVCYDDKLVWPEETLPRFMPFKPFSTMQELDHALQPVKDHLISIGVQGNHPLFHYPYLKHVCQLGDMQKQLLLP